MAITLTRYDFRDNNNDLWHFRQIQDSQGILYQLFDVNQKIVASGLDMKMSFGQWVVQLIEGMMGR